jgi:hypothetical protein
MDGGAEAGADGGDGDAAADVEQAPGAGETEKHECAECGDVVPANAGDFEGDNFYCLPCWNAADNGAAGAADEAEAEGQYRSEYDEVGGSGPVWLHGPITKEDAAAMAAPGGVVRPNGAFLLWERTPPEEYALTLVFKGKVTHHRVKWNASGGVWLVNKKAYTQDACLETLVANLALGVKGWPQALTGPIAVPLGGVGPTMTPAGSAAPPPSPSAANPATKADRRRTPAPDYGEEDEEEEVAVAVAVAAVPAGPSRAQLAQAAAEIEQQHEPAPAEVAAEVDAGVAGPEAWLHGQITKDQARQLVMDAGMRDGDFLVWERKPPYQYVLTLVFKGRDTYHQLRCANEPPPTRSLSSNGPQL